MIGRYHSLADDPSALHSPLHRQQSSWLTQMMEQYLANGGQITVIEQPLRPEKPQKQPRGHALRLAERKRRKVTRKDWDYLIDRHRKDQPDLPVEVTP